MCTIIVVTRQLLFTTTKTCITQCLRRSQHSSTKSFANSNLKKLLIEMPRNKPHIAEAQRQRLRIKEKASRYIPGTVNIQILGCGAPGAPASVYLFTDQSRYLFNCGEGTQRLAHEHKTKLARLEHIFMTRTSWQRIGGLPGLSLTVQDAGVPSLQLHAPPGMDDLFRAMRRFVILKDLKVEAVSCAAGDRYDDAVMCVSYVPIHKKVVEDAMEPTTASNASSRSQTPDADTTDYYEHESGAGTVRDSPTPSSLTNGRKEEEEHRRTEETSVMAFICQLKARPGALSLEKCVDKGVPPGPLLGQLKNGNSIRLADGRQVHAHEVRGPDDPGPVFCVVDIPSVEYLAGLEDVRSLFEPHQAGAKCDDDRATMVIHFTSQHILEHPEYQRFMDRFSASTLHLVLNETNKYDGLVIFASDKLCHKFHYRFSGYLAAHRIQYQLNQLNTFMFPLLK